MKKALGLSQTDIKRAVAGAIAGGMAAGSFKVVVTMDSISLVPISEGEKADSEDNEWDRLLGMGKFAKDGPLVTRPKR